MQTILELRRAQRDLAAQARDKFDEITDSTTAKKAAEIEAEFDDLMAEHDRLGRKIRALEAEDLSDPNWPKGEDTSAPGADDGMGDKQVLKPFGARHGQSIRTVSARPKDHRDQYENLPLGDYLRAIVRGGKTDLERRALAEGTDSAGGYTVPEFLSSQMIDALRAASVVSRAGAMTMPLTSKDNLIAKVLTDPSPGWRAEAAAIPEGDPTFGVVNMQPKALGVLVKVSWELMADSINMQTELPRVLTAAMATELDRVALVGSGSGAEPEGIANITGIGTTAHDAALASYAPLLTARTGILTANAGPVTAYIMHPRDAGTLAGLQATDNQPLVPPKVVGDIPFLETTAIPTDEGSNSPPDESLIIAGNFAHLIVGIREDIRIQSFPSLNAGTGQHTIIAWMRADIAVTHATAFHTITGIAAPS